MYNRIVTEPCKVIRGASALSLKNNWMMCITAFLLMTILSGILIMPSGEPQTLGEALKVLILSLYGLVVTGPFTYGISKIMLMVSRGQSASVMNVFDGFSKLFKTMGLLLYMTLFICLWSLLFIIPGIIAAIRYSMAFYIMIDNPDYSIRQCIEESKALMKGNVLKYVILQISFIGWILLTSLVSAAIISATTLIMPAVFAEYISMIGTFVISIPVSVYITMASAKFYDLTKPNFIS